jgi:hypothetical protein
VPTRLTTLSREQEEVVVAFLEHLAPSDDEVSSGADARLALDEWWLPGAYLRTEAMTPRAASGPPTYRDVGGGRYRLAIPTTLEGGGVHVVAEEHRTAEIWHGVVCGDVLADVTVNAYALAKRSLGDVEESLSRWLSPESRRWVEVPGARKARRLDGTTHRYSPAEPELTTAIIALGAAEVVALTVRGAERADVRAEMDRMIRSFVLLPDVEAEWARP